MSDVLESGATGAAPEPSRRTQAGDAAPAEAGTDNPTTEADSPPAGAANPKRRRRGTRGGRGRNRTRVATTPVGDGGDDDTEPELPDRPIEGKIQSPEVAERVLVRRPKIGDTRPAPEPPATKTGRPGAPPGPSTRKRRRGGATSAAGGRSGGGRTPARAVVTPSMVVAPVELDDETLERRRGRERKGRPVGRYLMGVHV